MATKEQIERIIQAVEHLNATGWSNSDTIASFAVGVSVASIVAAWRISVSQQKSERRRYTAQLHDWYWSVEMREIRQTVDATQLEWRKSDDPDDYIRKLLAKTNNGQNNTSWLHISRLLFFFSDLERHIRSKTVDKNLALEMFGRAQYEWFEDFFSAIRKQVEARYQGHNNPPSWLQETMAFEERLQKLKTA